MTVVEKETLDLYPVLRSLKVLDKRKRVVPFEPNWAQQQIIEQVSKDYEAGKPTRIICLKARQLGISTVTEAIIFCKAVMFEHTQAVVASLDVEQAEYLFDMTKRFYDEWPFKGIYPPKYSSKRQLYLTKIESDINVKTGENPKTFRGRTYTDAHVSEMAFYTKPVETMLALNQGMPAVQGNFQLIESTANGMGNHFEEEYWRAKEGKSEYTAFFFPWFRHYEYIPCAGEGCRDGTCPVCLEASKGLKPRDADERWLLANGATKAHLAWRRWAIPNLCLNNLDLFKQEYPATDEEAFIASGVNAFNLDDLKEVYEPLDPIYGDLVVKNGDVAFLPDPDGPIRIYKAPSESAKVADKKWGEYFIGADVGYGAEYGDFSAAHVINRRTKEQVAVLHARMQPSALADKLALLGKFYSRGDALPMIAVETNGPGLGTIERLRTIYPRVWMRRQFDAIPGTDRSERQAGWLTEWRNKVYLATQLADVVQRRGLTIHDEKTFKEMRVWTFYGGKGQADKFGPADTEKGHDDLVMSLGITMVCEAQEAPLGAYEVIESPDGVIWSKEQEEEDEW